MKLRKGNRNGPEISAERSLEDIVACLNARSLSIKERLHNWLGEDVKIPGFVDAENLKYTMVFLSKKLGMLGSLELIYGGYQVSPAELKRVAADGGPQGGEEREALMDEIYNKALSMFHCRPWKVFYYREGESLGTLEFLDEYSRRAKKFACRSAPPGCDMIKLLTPQGKVMVKTDMDESGKWEREDKTPACLGGHSLK
jgi:hypothetical protein